MTATCRQTAIRTAIIWEGDDATQSKNYLSRVASRCLPFANTLLDLGIKKGDVVAIYMPMVPEAAVAMLACARLAGALVIFGGFSPEAVAGRIIDLQFTPGDSPPTKACALDPASR
ncbi:AMP-binding protein [Shigella flexneri]